MSLYQFAAVVDGVNEMNSDGEPQAPTPEEYEAAMRAHDAIERF